MSERVIGKVVAITGAARGIGFATAGLLASQGAQVAIGDIDVDALAPASERLGITSGYRLDVTDPDSFDEFLAAVERNLGPIDVLVNNAGILPAGAVADEPDEVSRRVIDVNLLGTITGTKRALRSMLARRRGHIINIASISGETYGGGEATYCASKYGVVGFTDAARFELASSGVRFTLVMPTLVDTELTSGVGALRGIKAFKKVPAEQVAAAVLQAIRRPRRRIYVPTSVGALIYARRFVPVQIGEAIAARIGARTVFLDVDDSARRLYRERIKG